MVFQVLDRDRDGRLKVAVLVGIDAAKEQLQH